MRLPLAMARTWGGARKGAGRKPRGRPSMPHATRPKIDPRCPVQVTIRATPGLPSLRSPRVFGALRRAIAQASVDRFRVIHFSIQQDHGHFIVEGDEARRARGGVHGLAIRFALAVNRALGRRGKVVGDRIPPDRSQRRGTCGRAWFTCCSTSASTSAPPRASIHVARVSSFRGGITRRRQLTTRRPRPTHRLGWRALAGGARAGRCGWRNSRPPRRDRVRLDFADVAPTERPQVVTTGARRQSGTPRT
jgi:hypothetical protein